jgi:acrylyl-CoA reductase (NADPH)
MCPRQLRERAWKRLSEDVDVAKLENLIQVIPLEKVPHASRDILAGEVRGRIVVETSLQ